LRSPGGSSPVGAWATSNDELLKKALPPSAAASRIFFTGPSLMPAVNPMGLRPPDVPELPCQVDHIYSAALSLARGAAMVDCIPGAKRCGRGVDEAGNGCRNPAMATVIFYPARKTP
jgi:hypothetical protein